MILLFTPLKTWWRPSIAYLLQLISDLFALMILFQIDNYTGTQFSYWSKQFLGLKSSSNLLRKGGKGQKTNSNGDKWVVYLLLQRTCTFWTRGTICFANFPFTHFKYFLNWIFSTLIWFNYCCYTNRCIANDMLSLWYALSQYWNKEIFFS